MSSKKPRRPATSSNDVQEIFDKILGTRIVLVLERVQANTWLGHLVVVKPELASASGTKRAKITQDLYSIAALAESFTSRRPSASPHVVSKFLDSLDSEGRSTGTITH